MLEISGAVSLLQPVVKTAAKRENAASHGNAGLNSDLCMRISVCMRGKNSQNSMERY